MILIEEELRRGEGSNLVKIKQTNKQKEHKDAAKRHEPKV